jgi:NitT/TauT family transport system permease protein
MMTTDVQSGGAAKGETTKPKVSRIMAARAWTKRHALAALILLGLLVAWEASVRAFHVPVYIFPAPSEVLGVLYTKRAMFLAESVPTIIETLIGFLIGNGFAVVLAVLLLYVRSLEGAIMSLAITLRSVPLVALAPLLVLLLGDGYAPRVVVVAIICFFPTLVNTHLGLTSAERSATELFDSLSASSFQRLRKLQFPSALPPLFAALKVAASSAVLGAIIAEWVNSNRGLGFVIIQSTYQSQARELYGAIIVSSALSIAFYMLIVQFEKVVVTWQVRTDT